MSPWAYDMENAELMQAFWKATARAAVSGSGLVIDFARSSHHAEAFYLYGVVLARLEGKRPPFVRGDKVRINPKETYYCGSVNTVGEYSVIGEVKPGTTHEISRIFYESRNRYNIGGNEYLGWTLSFEKKKDSGEDWEGYRFPAERFEKVEQKKRVPA